MDITITLDFNKPHEKYVHIDYQIKWQQSTKTATKLILPSWTPGSYLIRDFATHIEAVQAFNDSGDAVAVTKNSKAEWQFATVGARSLKLRYKVYANDLSPRAAYCDHELGFVNPAAVLLFPQGALQNPIQLKIKVPPRWQLALAKKALRGSYSFQNFDELYDTPILTSPLLECRQFKVNSTQYELATFGPHHTDLNHVVADLKKIIAKQIPIFGDNPCARYVFQLIFVKGAYGGLEHCFSSTNLFDGLSLLDAKRYPILMALLSHEHFHLWNVKRIRPQELGPFDYTREAYTRELWLAEGVTSYYDDHTLLRAGVYSTTAYLEVIAENIEKLLSGKGAQLNSLSEASFDAWIRYYRPNENSLNTSVNYYLKGGLVGLLLDLEIIKKSRGRATLDDVMRELYRRFKSRPEVGITRGEFFAVVESLTGCTFQEFVAKYIDGTTAIDWQKAFAEFGIVLETDKKTKESYFLGLTLKDLAGKVVIDKISEDTPSFHSILQSGDEIIAINGERMDTLKKIDVVDRSPKVKVLFARRGLVYDTEFTLVKKSTAAKKLVISQKITSQQKKYLNLFLRRSSKG